MGTIKSFEQIEAWKKARILNQRIFELTKADKFLRDYVWKDQIRRSSLSIMSNIAEGFERDGNREFIQFLSIAKGSGGELISQLYAGLDIGYLNQSDFDKLYEETLEINRLIGGSLQYLKNSPLKGVKYNLTRNIKV